MVKIKLKKSVLFLFISLVALNVNAQDPTRFSGEVENLKSRTWNIDDSRDKLLFTGSSSIRFWINMGDYFPEYQTMNTGFGGSQFSDLNHYAEELILQHQPDRILIYEGDNDVSEGKSAETILADANKLLEIIREKYPDTKVYFISPKPSIARWELKDTYLEVNQRLAELAVDSANLFFIDIWHPMLNEGGYLDDDLFIEDKLHMTKKGYDIWGKVIGEALNWIPENGSVSNYLDLIQNKKWYLVDGPTGAKVNESLYSQFSDSTWVTFDNGEKVEAEKYHFSDSCNFEIDKVARVQKGKYLVKEWSSVCYEVEAINESVLNLFYIRSGRFLIYESD